MLVAGAHHLGDRLAIAQRLRHERLAAGVTHRGPYKDGPGEINVVVSVGGMVVRPGDLVAGDHDGVVAIAAGTWDRTWVDEALKARGCDPA